MMDIAEMVKNYRGDCCKIHFNIESAGLGFTGGKV